MGVYVNPGNSGFAEIDDEDYVDKTLLIELVNQSIGRKNKLTCVSRPRRFGKWRGFSKYVQQKDRKTEQIERRNK